MKRRAWPMTAQQTLAIVVVLGGTGYAVAEMVRVAFPAVPLWVAWPLGVLLAFRLVREAAGN